MQIQTYNQVKTISFQRVVLRKRADQQAQLFRCWRCTVPIAQVIGDIVRISPNETDNEQALVLHQCRTCKELYTFTTKPYQAPVTTIVLSTSNLPEAGNTFHCVICRSPLVQFSPRFIQSLLTHQDLSLPSTIACQKCQRRYLIFDLVYAPTVL